MFKYVKFNDVGRQVEFRLLAEAPADDSALYKVPVYLEDVADLKLVNGDIVPVPAAEIAKELEELRAEQAIRALLTLLEELFNEKARSRGYDNRITVALRAGYPGPFQQEGIVFATWMDECNKKCYVELEKFKQGLRTLPATPADFLNELPKLVWPDQNTTTA